MATRSILRRPCPYPEVTFAIPHRSIKADVGILISASHNDYRYNGYKLSCANGSQFDPQQRDEMYNKYIAKAKFEDLRLCSFHEAPEGKLWFLGGAQPRPITTTRAARPTSSTFIRNTTIMCAGSCSPMIWAAPGVRARSAAHRLLRLSRRGVRGRAPAAAGGGVFRRLDQVHSRGRVE